MFTSEVPEYFGMADRLRCIWKMADYGEHGMDEINKINETDLQRLVM